MRRVKIYRDHSRTSFLACDNGGNFFQVLLLSVDLGELLNTFEVLCTLLALSVFFVAKNRVVVCIICSRRAFIYALVKAPT